MKPVEVKSEIWQTLIEVNSKRQLHNGYLIKVKYNENQGDSISYL